MKLLVILLTNLVYKNWSGGNPISAKLSLSGWFHWLNRLDRLNAQPLWLTLVIFTAVPVCLVFIVEFLFAQWLAILIACLGDWQGIRDRADQGLALHPADSPQALTDLASKLEEELLVSRFRQFFSPVTWYLLLGPTGLVIYFCCATFQQLSEGEEADDFASGIMVYIDWVPIKLTTLLFTLTGNFVDTCAEWLDSLLKQDESVGLLLMRASRAAITVRVPDPETSENLREDIEMEIEELVLLLDRTQWAMLGPAALVTIIGF